MLEFPINFVFFERTPWPELLRRTPKKIEDARLAELCISSWDAWIFRSFYELERRGYPATLSQYPREGVINFCLSWTVTRRNRKIRDFIVILRGDGPRSRIGNFLVSQNGYLLAPEREGYLPHWPQPGIMPRNKARGELFETVTYLGWPGNLASEFREPAFSQKLSEIGLALRLPPEDRSQQGLFWADYQNTDAVIAIRRASQYDLLNKPGSKLINAWIGEVPAILGAEYGYREIQRTKLDYIEATSATEVLSALKLLRDSPKTRDEMVQNGVERRREYSSDAIFQRWVDLIHQRIGPSFTLWNSTIYPKKIYHVVRGIAAEKKIVKEHKKQVFESPKVTSYNMAHSRK